MIPELKEQTFYKLTIKNNEVTIVYCYKNPDYLDGSTIGFGFNIADGGGWMPACDVSKETTIAEVEFTEVK